MGRTATPKQRIGLSVGAFVAAQSVMALSHEGMIGTIIAAGIAYAGWSFADEVFSKVTDDEGNNSPRPAVKGRGLGYRLITPRSARKPPDWMPSDEEVDAEIARAYEEDAEPFLLGSDDGIKTFKQLIESGVIQQMLREDSKKPFLERRVIIGHVQGKLYYVTIQDLYSCGIGGTSGTGKSTTVRFLLFQFILRGFKLVMIDPHIKDVEESLAAQFTLFPGVHALAPCGEDDEALKKVARKMQAEFDRRVDTGDKSGVPILFVVDEFNILMRSSKISDETKAVLTKALLDIEQGGRKFGMFVWIIGQKWANQDLGNSDGVAVRTSMVSRIAHRFSDSDQACLFMGVKNAKVREQNARLVRGCYLFVNANGDRYEVTTPPTFATDGRLVLSLLPKAPAQRVEAKTVVAIEDEEDLETLRTMPYREYLKTRHWQRTRKQALLDAEYRCRVCNAGDTQLDVHHRTYARRGCEKPNDLIVLCHECHEIFEINGKLAKNYPTEGFRQSFDHFRPDEEPDEGQFYARNVVPESVQKASENVEFSSHEATRSGRSVEAEVASEQAVDTQNGDDAPVALPPGWTDEKVTLLPGFYRVFGNLDKCLEAVDVSTYPRNRDFARDILKQQGLRKG